MKRNEMIIEKKISKVVRDLLMEMAEENTADEVSTETTGNLMLDDEKEDDWHCECYTDELREKAIDCLSEYGGFRRGYKLAKPEDIEKKIIDCFSDNFDVTAELIELPKEHFGGEEIKFELTDKKNSDTKYILSIFQKESDKLRFPGYFKIHNIHVLDDSYISPKEEEPEMDNTDKSLNEAKSLINRMEILA